jgi:hypothetical protein
MDRDKIARLLAELLPGFLDDELFQLWEEHGFHLTRNDFLSPIPDTRTLADHLWEQESEMVGIDLNLPRQLELLKEVFPRFQQEYDDLPAAATGVSHQFYFDNSFFSGTDALVLYCMIRHFQPELILEVGAGFSSLLSAQAQRKNGKGRLVSIEPHPSPILEAGFPGLDELIKSKVENVGLGIFAQLGPGDILFIDSSHVARIGSDVNFLFFEVLPRLNPGVIVHVHDIFLPFEYKKEWIQDSHWFWNEQYLLRSFLAFNSEFEVLFGNSYMGHKFQHEMVAAFPRSPWWGGGSFWMRRKPATPR